MTEQNTRALTDEQIAAQEARYAIDGAISYGRMGTNQPPAGHWLTEFWAIGQQLAELGKTSAWDNQTPVASTPAAAWRVNGETDPHGDFYDRERAMLTLGAMTDDVLANAVYLHGNERPPIEDIIAGKAHMPIVYLTAAKDRIRWLSRALVKALAAPAAPSSSALTDEGAMRVALRIMADLDDRKGLLDGVDDDTKADIADEIAVTIRTAMSASKED